MTEGSKTKDIDITLGRALQTFSASGRIVDDKDVPVQNLRFGLQRGEGPRMEFVNSMAITNSQGDFIVEGLIPGKYGIYLFPNQGNDMRMQNVRFDIVVQNVAGITIKLSKGGSISGVLDGTFALNNLPPGKYWSLAPSDKRPYGSCVNLNRPPAPSFIAPPKLTRARSN